MYLFITQNWQGKPFVSQEVIANLIRCYSTKIGSKVHCEVDKNDHMIGQNVSKNELNAIISNVLAFVENG